MAFTDTLSYYLENLGILDFFLPFVLVFTITFAVLQKIKLFEDKRFSGVIAFAAGLLFVIPHITGNYPAGYDPVQIINESLPSVALVGVAIVMVLLLLGIFGKPEEGGFGAILNPFIIAIAIGFILYIFGSSLDLWSGPYDVFSWWTEEVTEILIIVFIFGLIVRLIVGGGTKTKRKNAAGKEIETFADWMDDLGQKIFPKTK